MQHRAPGAQAWTEAGFVPGAGTTEAEQQYTFHLDALALGTHAFRLRQVGLDGTATYSPQVEAEIVMSTPFRVLAPYPNPTRGTATLNVAVAEMQAVEVIVYDALGRRVAVAFSGDLEAQQEVALPLVTEGLPSGVYVVAIVGERFRATQRLTVSR